MQWLLAVLGILAAPAALGDILWGRIDLPGQNMQLVAVLDGRSQTAYLQMSGPTNGWFGWGLGTQTMEGYALIVNTTAPVIREVLMTDYVTPATDSLQETTGTSCTTNGIVHYFLKRPLTSASGSHYSFPAQPASIPVCWAMSSTRSFFMHTDFGSGSLGSTNAPAPVFTGVRAAGGVATLYLTNLIFSVTNQVQASGSVSGGSWNTLTNILVQPPCGSPIHSFVASLQVAATNENAGFYRVRQ